MLRLRLALVVFAIAILMYGPNASAVPAALAELAPSGKLRVGVVVAPTPSASFAIKDASGNLRGVAVTLGTELAEKLGVAVEFVPYPNSGELSEAVRGHACEVAFLPVDEERKKQVEFGPAYNLFESTLLVPSGSNIATLADANRAGVRVVGIAPIRPRSGAHSARSRRRS